MKIEKAIEHMKSYKKMHADEYFDMAIEALEKQSPKKVTEKVEERYLTLGKSFFCPSCEVMLGDWIFLRCRTNHCGNCGQRLK